MKILEQLDLCLFLSFVSSSVAFTCKTGDQTSSLHLSVRFLFRWLWRHRKTFNINTEKFYSCTVVYFTLADLLETNKVQEANFRECHWCISIHFASVYFDEKWADILKLLVVLGREKKIWFRSFPQFQIAQKNNSTILLWSTILGNYSLHCSKQNSTFVVEFNSNLKTSGGARSPLPLSLLRTCGWWQIFMSITNAKSGNKEIKSPNELRLAMRNAGLISNRMQKNKQKFDAKWWKTKNSDCLISWRLREPI